MPAQGIAITPRLLSRWPLPRLDAEGDKEDRGHILVVAGAADVPGAAVLAATAALRAGAGKMSIATAASITGVVAQAIPEARVLPIAPGPRGLGSLRKTHFDAILAGPGLAASSALSRWVRAERARRPQSTFVIDAGALAALEAKTLQVPGATDQPRCVVTPHAGEMAKLLGCSKDFVVTNARSVALTVARARQVVVVLKGATTYIAEPGGTLWRHTARNLALATSGSGDVLAGVIAGLAARGATCAQAAVWGVALHGLAGKRLAGTHGGLGVLARELPHEIPRLMHRLSR